MRPQPACEGLEQTYPRFRNRNVTRRLQHPFASNMFSSIGCIKRPGVLLEWGSMRPGHERVARRSGNWRHLMSEKRREHDDGPASAVRIEQRAGAQFQVPAGVVFVIA